MTFPDDFAAEWRAEEQADRAFEALRRAFLTYRMRRRCGRELNHRLLVLGTALFGLGVEADYVTEKMRDLADQLASLRIAAQAERLSAWGPWR